MDCPACGRSLPTAFPGATVSCGCGASVTVPAGAPRPTTISGDRASGGPYRGSSPSVSEPATTRCPFCSNVCPSLVRVCPHCDVRLENVRCVRCYSLQEPGSFSCRRCGQNLELEPLLDATDAPCPRCRTPLEAASTAPEEGGVERTHECPRCGGIFVPREVLAEILSRAEVQGSFVAPPAPPGLEPVTYIPCPLCHTPMNRTNFGRYSGVIVDVCKRHGTWFDPGELTRVIAFVASGGLAKTRAREEQDQKAAVSKRAQAQLELNVYTSRYEAEQGLKVWRDLLDTLLWIP